MTELLIYESRWENDAETLREQQYLYCIERLLEIKDDDERETND